MTILFFLLSFFLSFTIMHNSCIRTCVSFFSFPSKTPSKGLIPNINTCLYVCVLSFRFLYNSVLTNIQRMTRFINRLRDSIHCHNCSKLWKNALQMAVSWLKYGSTYPVMAKSSKAYIIEYLKLFLNGLIGTCKKEIKYVNPW